MKMLDINIRFTSESSLARLARLAFFLLNKPILKGDRGCSQMASNG
jgi:hypothetical protein